MEVGYLRSKHSLLVWRLRWFFAIAVASGCAYLPLVLARGDEGTSGGVGREATRVWAISLSGLLAANFSFLVALRLRDGRLMFRNHLFLEVSAVTLMVASMLLVLMCSPNRFVKLRGHRIVDAFDVPYDSDSSFLLLMDCYITAAHLGMPIRWFVLAPLEGAAVLFYLVHVAFIGSEEPPQQVFLNCVLLTTLTLASAISKRSAELEDRRAFLRLLREQTMRCEAEFQLSQAAGDAKRSGPPSERRSEVTDKSGAIFDAACEGGEKSAGLLELVATRGQQEHWCIDASEVRLLAEAPLGEGSFGSVRRAVFSGMLVALKCPRVVPGAIRVPELCNELRVLRHLRHPNIVAVHGAVVLPEERQLFLVLELVHGVELKAFLMPSDDEPGPSVMARYQIMHGVCQALLYMHTRKPHIVHGDLKGSNILVRQVGQDALPKLLDFGLSRVVHRRTRPLGGTLAWIAPEVLAHAPVRCSSDIYSLGRLLAFCATSVPPLQHMSSKMIIRALRRQPPLPSWPEGCAFVCLRPLVQACLQQRQLDRPSAAAVQASLLRLAPQLPLPSEAQRSFHALAEALAGTGADVQALALEQREAMALPQRRDLGPVPENEAAPEGKAQPAPPEPREEVARAWPYPGRLTTCEPARHAALLAALQRINAPLGSACCERHAVLRLGLDLCEEGLAGGCGRGELPRPGPETQCDYCGVLGVNGHCCDLCSWEKEAGQLEESATASGTTAVSRSEYMTL